MLVLLFERYCFLCITVTHGNDESPLSFGVARILDTTIGIMIALIKNNFQSAEQQAAAYGVKESGESCGYGRLRFRGIIKFPYSAETIGKAETVEER